MKTMERKQFSLDVSPRKSRPGEKPAKHWGSGGDVTNSVADKRKGGKKTCENTMGFCGVVGGSFFYWGGDVGPDQEVCYEARGGYHLKLKKKGSNFLLSAKWP